MADIDYNEQRQKWIALLTKPAAQALIRHLSRDEIQAQIPELLAECVLVEDYEDILLLKVIQKPEAVRWLQQICDADCARMRAKQAEEFPDG